MSRVALIGTGQVAHALAQRVDAARQRGGFGPTLVQVFNARGGAGVHGGTWRAAVERQAACTARREPAAAPVVRDAVEAVIDLSDSDAVAACHPRWLAEGRVVVTANKRGLGGPHLRASGLMAAIHREHQYGDAATVGAGLGALARLRELRACGERIFCIRGVLSGSLAWLFDGFDGGEPFSARVMQARVLGLTEPDPREDVSGRDVVRKLSILARAAGWTVADGAVEVDGHLMLAQGEDWQADIKALDPGLARLASQAPGPAARLAVVAEARPGVQRVSVQWLQPDDPLAARRGCDNAIAIRCERYAEQPLVLRGPGAGPALTAAAVFEDLARGLALQRVPAAV